MRVEGDLDASVASRLLAEIGIPGAMIQPMGGRSVIRGKIAKYAEAARQSPWFVLVDLDSDECPASLRNEWLGNTDSPIIFRVAVRTVESWILADQAGIASFLAVPVARIPAMPEILPDPKGTLVSLAARSKRRTVRDGVAPRLEAGKKVGPLYTQMLVEFVREHWNIDSAMVASPSLARCIAALSQLLEEE